MVVIRTHDDVIDEYFRGPRCVVGFDQGRFEAIVAQYQRKKPASVGVWHDPSDVARVYLQEGGCVVHDFPACAIFEVEGEQGHFFARAVTGQSDTGEEEFKREGRGEVISRSGIGVSHRIEAYDGIDAPGCICSGNGVGAGICVTSSDVYRHIVGI